MNAYHSWHYSLGKKTGYFPGPTERYGLQGKAYLRPLVKQHPVTGRKSLFLASHAFGIPGMTREESTKLLDDLTETACQAPRTYKHSWTLGDLVLWDNLRDRHRHCWGYY